MKNLRSGLIGTFLMLLFHFTSAQRPFNTSYQTDLPIALVGAGITLTGYFMTTQVSPLTTAEIMALDPNRVARIDRWSTEMSWSPAKRLSDGLLITSLALPVLYLGHQTPRSEYLTLGIMGMEAALITAGLTLTSKALVKRPRPYAYNPNVPVSEKMIRDTRFSFFSGHTSMASVASFFTYSTLKQYLEDGTAKTALAVTSVALPGFLAGFRIAAGKHYLTDVLVGYGIGALVGVGIPAIHRSGTSKLKVQATGRGMTLRYSI